MPDGHDQATGLRRLFARDALHVVSVRGAGDCRATSVTIDLAVALAALGHRPLIIDLEHGHVAATLGMKPRYELAHVLCGDKALADVLLKDKSGVAVLPAMQETALSGSWKRMLSDLLRDARQTFNVWLINGGNVPVADADSPLVVIEPTRDAITDAYSQIKALARMHGQREFRIVVDRATSESAARSVYASIAETSRRFLSARVDYCGYLPRDAGGPPVRSGARGAAQSPRAYAFSQLAEAVVSAMPAGAPQPALHMGS